MALSFLLRKIYKLYYERKTGSRRQTVVLEILDREVTILSDKNR